MAMTRIEITKRELGKFEEALGETATRGPAPGVHKRIWEAQCEALQSMIDDLREQLVELEAAAK